MSTRRPSEYAREGTKEAPGWTIYGFDRVKKLEKQAVKMILQSGGGMRNKSWRI